MYSSKKEVDTHVRIAFSKIRSERDRALRGLTIAKLYIRIKEFTTAEQYICSYLGVKNDNDQAHKMLGQCYQALKQPKKALESFQRSLQLNQKQPDLLAQVCQLLVDDDQLNTNKAQYWCELAESSKVESESVYALRMKIMTSSSATTNEIESMLRKEISGRPNDVGPRVRLVRHFLDQDQILEAFKYVHEFELQQNEAFNNSSEWYNIVWLVLSKYEQLPDVRKDWELWLLVGICLDRLVFLSFMTLDSGTGNSVTETANLLFRLDQYLYKITKMSDKLQAQREFVALFLEHYCGQLLFHAVALIFKRELVQKKNKWRETMQLAFPLLLLTYHMNPKDINKESWMKHCDENCARLIQLWYREGSFRCAQSGRVLLSCIMDENKVNRSTEVNGVFGAQPVPTWTSGDELMAIIRQTCADKGWKHKVFSHLFCNSDQRLKEQTSLIVRCANRAEPVYDLPAVSTLESYEEVSQYLRPQSLRHMVYLFLSYEDLSNVRAKFFNGLNFSSSNLSFCAAESLNQLDVDSYLYATIIEAKRALEINRKSAECTYGISTSSDQNTVCRPRIFPYVNMQHDLCTDEQISWWSLAYKVYKNLAKFENAAQMRADLQQGIEVVRGINGPKMDILIVFMLGKIFSKRSRRATKPVERGCLEARAECLYLHGLKMFKLHNRAVLEPFRKTFKYKACEKDLIEYSENAVLFLSDRMLKKAQYEELIEELHGVALPFATYKQAEAYRKMAEDSNTSKSSKQRFTERAVECLQQTHELLKNTIIDTNHPLNTTIHTELKRMQHNAKKLNESKRNDDALDSSFVSESGGTSGSVGIHNNSSTYEDALTQFFSPSNNRSTQQRELVASLLAATNTTPVTSATSNNSELESIVKQMLSTLGIVKEEIVCAIKPEVVLMRQEMTVLKDKVAQIEDCMRKARISSSPPPSRYDDGCSNVLEDLYMAEDALSQQMYQQQSQNFLPNAMLTNHTSTPNTFGNNMQQQNQQQPSLPPPILNQQRLPLNSQQTGSTPMQQLPFNGQMYNPNYTYNCYGSNFPYMLGQQNNAGNPMMAPRGQMNLPFPEHGPNGMNLNMPPTTPIFQTGLTGTTAQTPLMQNTLPDGRSNGMFNYLNATQPTTPAGPPLPIQPPAVLPPLHSLPTLTSALSMPQPTVTSSPLILNPPSLPTNVNVAFNKALNNQPVEKGPPANVVITSSDPLPNPRNVNQLQMQQPTLSVTIPSHHIKQSLVQPTEMTASAFGSLPQPQQLPPMNNVGGGGGGGSSSGLFGNNSFGNNSVVNNSFGLNNSNSFNFGGSSNQNSFSTANKDATANFLSTFSFKPAVEKAMAANNSASSVGEKDQKDNTTVLPLTESTLNEFNKSLDAESAEYDPRPDFQAIIPLPAEIEVRTGEEDEEIMFSEHAKLYRFVDKEWKERGIGTIKILKNLDDQSSRILMRRDQTHKICANHKITKDLKLVAKLEKNGHTWAAPDFADGEVKSEIFYIRFKERDLAQNFQHAFKQAQNDDERLAEEKENKDIEKEKDNEKENQKQNQKEKEKEKQKLASEKEKLELEKEIPAFGLSKSAAINNFASSTPTGKMQIKINDDQQQQQQKPAKSTSNENKSIFGALNLTSSVASSTSATSPITTTTVTSKPNIFANFTFGSVSSSASTTTPALSTVTSSSTTTPFNANIFGKPSESPFSIANLKFPSFGSTQAAINESTASTSSATGTSTASNLNKSNASDNEDEYVPTAQFKPVIALPDLVEVTTGEEDYKQLFEHRSKLLRFDKETREWKERGIGNMRLLQNKQNKDDVRLVMRREQIHKLCCNQRIYKDTEFKFAKSSPTALQWVGHDYSESELSTEYLTLRFKTQDICKEFYDTLMLVQREMSEKAVLQTAGKEVETAEADSTTKSNNNETKASAPGSGTEIKGFGDAFKPKAGSWTCQGCYSINQADKLYCPSCEAPKDDTVPKKESINKEPFNLTTKTAFTFGFGNSGDSNAQTAQKNPFILSNNTNNSSDGGSANKSFVFGKPATTITPTSSSINKSSSTAAPTAIDFGDKFKPKPGSWDCPDCYTNNEASKNYCAACEAPKDSSIPKKEVSTTDNANKNILALSDPTQKFSFGFPSPTKATTSDAAASLPTLAKPIFSFNLQSKSSMAPTENIAFSSPFSLNKKEFTFTMSSKSSDTEIPKTIGTSDADNADADDSSHLHEEEENNAYFAPVIPLPDKIDVKTGEEDEEILYQHRAKLYRFADGEWKERGIGDIKILRHNQTKKLRVIMRRDQVHKLCLNHVLNEDVEYKAKDEKSWLFVVNDFSEGEVQLEKLSLRFKTKEIATDFMNAIKNALSGIGEPKPIGLNGHHNTTEKSKEESVQQKPALKEKTENIIEKQRTENIMKVKPKWSLVQPELKSPNSSEFNISTNRSFSLKHSALLASPQLKPAETKFDDTIKSPPPVDFSFKAALKENDDAKAKTPVSGGFLFGSGDNTSSANKFGSSIFGGGAPANQPLFGEASNIFGFSTTAAKPKEAQTGKTTTGNEPKYFFGEKNEKTNESAPPTSGLKSIFGGSAGTEVKTSFFSTPSNANSTSIFDANKTGSIATIGNQQKEQQQQPQQQQQQQQQKSIFGVNNTTSGMTGGSLFGGTASFLNPNKNGSIFGGGANIGDQQGKNNNPATDNARAFNFADLSAKSDGLDFASLAAASNKNNATSKTEKPGPGGFIGLTNQDAFSSFLKSTNKSENKDGNANNTDGDVDASGAADDDNYDPHYEPIIPLPKEIVVSTGEEDEEKLFSERGILFRYDADTKEWKERGIGEVKILKHTQSNRFRLLLRREQVHKLVLNFPITESFKFNSMKNNLKSFLFVGMNYAESTQGVYEKLAVRFKKLDIAEQFSDNLNSCVEAMQQNANAK